MESGTVTWRLPFRALVSDRNEERFDLWDIANDGCYFYVVNKPVGCVYLISAEGQVLGKVLENLPNPTYLSIHAGTNKMAVVCHSRHIKVYKLTYAFQR